MTIHIPEIPFDWTGVWVWGIIMLLLGVCIAIGALILKFKDNGVMLGFAIIVTFIWGLVGGSYLISNVYSEHADRVGEAQIKEMNKLGITEIDLDDEGTFTGSKDGRYVKGYLIEVVPDRVYQIAEVIK